MVPATIGTMKTVVTCAKCGKESAEIEGEYRLPAPGMERTPLANEPRMPKGWQVTAGGFIGPRCAETKT